jgi:uncharacterized protein (TIGR03118 family)
MLNRKHILTSAASLLLLYSCSSTTTAPQSNTTQFVVTNLVSDVDAFHPKLIDTNLVNSWGLSFGSTGFPWISDEATGVTTFYNTDSATPIKKGQFRIESATSDPSPVIGTVFNTSSAFLVGASKSFFLFSSEDGSLTAWKPGDSIASLVKQPTDGDSYTGLTLAGSVLYAANFESGMVDMYDGMYNKIGYFRDSSAPADYFPFNVQQIDDDIYVAYAAKDGDDEKKGAGLGIISRFNAAGKLLQRVVTGGQLNAPWGMAKATSSFGDLSGDLLIGNFGDGHINVYSTSGNYIGQIKDASGNPITIDGLWALMFRPDGKDQDELYFTAGPNDETHGLFGTISPK